MKRDSRATASTSLDAYLSEIHQFPLLTVEEEQSLARTFRDKGDARAAHRLVTANLRFVVKVAHEYRSYGFTLIDLVQEGNIGLMKAVQKFDPDKGIRLISYAVWWIRAYIQNHILKSFSLVKLGTTQAQRKLFFSLARTRRELDAMSAEHGLDSDGADPEKIAKKLNVKRGEVEEMTQRMHGRDVSIDAPVGDDGGSTQGDFLAGHSPPHDHALADAQEQKMMQGRIGAALALLSERERFIVEHRLMSDEPLTLKEIGERFHVSRERARQLEIRATQKLKRELHALAVDIDWPTGGQTAGADERAAA
ncbi:MAG TPA: RNA polymerase factor sigma-32 [Anaeromyxobacteraceae bacterium]